MPEPERRARLFVIGGAALDTLHVGGRTVRTAGGAGLYTALAAARAGARVVLLAPRPEPMPAELEPAAARLDWRGPRVGVAELPAFEIAYRRDGAMEMLDSRPGGRPWPAPAKLPGELDGAPVFLAALAAPPRQLALLDELRRRRCRVATGIHPCALDRHRQTVRHLLERSDRFFLNAGEAATLFGRLDLAAAPPGRLLFVTRGAEGARVIAGTTATDVDAVPAEVLDPTGAGDAFAGITLALLERGLDPVAAAHRAVAGAAEVVGAVGAEALLAPPPARSRPAARRVP